ncbi:MAG: hypothetical protein ACXVYV_02820, partial [Gaiellales bacterium]
MRRMLWWPSPGKFRPRLLLSLIAIVVMLVVAGLSLLSDRAAAQRAKQEAMLQLQIDVNRASAVEWEAIAGGYATAHVNRELEWQLARIRADLGRVAGDPDFSALPELTRHIESYRSALRDEFHLLQAGQFSSAERVDATRVDPAFDSLHHLAQAQAAIQGRGAALTDRVARWGSAVVLGVGALLIAVLLVAYERGGRRTALVEARESL